MIWRQRPIKLSKIIFSTYLKFQLSLVKKKRIKLFEWVRPLHLDDEDGNPGPRIAAHVREEGVNVERVLSEEVHS